MFGILRLQDTAQTQDNPDVPPLRDITECEFSWCGLVFNEISMTQGTTTIPNPASTWPVSAMNPSNITEDLGTWAPGYWQYFDPDVAEAELTYVALNVYNDTGRCYSIFFSLDPMHKLAVST